MLLLLDIGNTNTHLGLANQNRVLRQAILPTAGWFSGKIQAAIRAFFARKEITGATFCSVVPKATPRCAAFLKGLAVPAIELNHKTVRGVGIDYPRPETIGPDRLANAVAARAKYGAPALVVDFGTAVTFDVVNAEGNYAGGIIAPGLSAMTDYLHEKTALLPRIKIRDTKAVIGRNTREAMLIGAVHGYRGLVQNLIHELQRELRAKKLPVIATGGCAELIAEDLEEITEVDPLITLEGLRLVWANHFRTGGKFLRQTPRAARRPK
jgi:type III pantothenate kinase